MSQTLRRGAGQARFVRDLAYLAGFYAMSTLVRTIPRSRSASDAASDAGPQRRVRGQLRFWREVAYVAAFYAIYSLVRNMQGSASVSTAHAMHNALRIIRLEQLLGIYHEQAVQQAFLGSRLFIGFWNFFYGSFHFIVTAFALMFLFRRFPERYRKYRNTLAFTTGLALAGFAAFPLMPPRLLPASYGYVDTLARYGALWSFDSGAMHKISNQYAAMPSLHFAWSTWCALALVPALRQPWAKVLAALYPLLTLFAIVVTANHFVIDAVGGVLVLGTGMLLGFPLAARVERRTGGAATATPPPPAPPPVPARAKAALVSATS